MPREPLQPVVVVLSSPGDLNREREEARRVVEWLNERVATPLNVWVDLKRWEDTGPYGGPPQEPLTAWVNDCDVFVGMLWEAWGERTRAYSSGFEEEFTRANERFEQEGRPEILLFFRDVHPAHSRSPSVELEQNLRFRREREEKKDHRVQKYSTEDEFAGGFRDSLMTYVLSRASAHRPTSGPEESASKTPPSAQAVEESLGGEPQGDTSQVAGVLQKGRGFILGCGANPLSGGERARLYLLAAAWLFGDAGGVVPEILGAHECNVFYAQRESLELLGDEWMLLVRSLVGDVHATRPGYYWARHWSDEDTARFLSYLAVHDVASQVRAGALRLLAIIGHEPEGDLVERCSKDPSTEVRLELIRYLRAGSLVAHAGVAQRLMSDDDWGVRGKAEQAYYVLTAQQDPDKAFREVVERKSATEQLLSALLPYRARASTKALRAMLETDSRYAQLFALEGLAETAQITEEETRRFARSQDTELAAAGMLALLQLDEAIDEELRALDERLTEDHVRGFGWLSVHRPRPDKRIRIARAHRLSKNELLDMLHSNLSSFDTAPVYRALALEHFDDVQDLLREDIKSGFASLRRRRVERVRTELGDAVAVLVEPLTPEISDFARRWFVEAIMVGLAKHGGQEDLAVAREVVGDAAYSDEARVCAAYLLSRHGVASDTAALLAIATSGYGELKRAAAEAALALAPGLDGAAAKLLASQSPELIVAALKHLRKRPLVDTVRDAAIGLLHSSVLAIRNAAVAFLVQVLPDGALEDLLEDYTSSQPSYYYSVVCQLDKVVYAPTCLRERFRREIAGVLE